MGRNLINMCPTRVMKNTWPKAEIGCIHDVGAVTSFVKWITVSTWTQSTSWNHTFTRNVVFLIGVLFPAYFELSSFDQSTPGFPRGRLRTLFRTFLRTVDSLWPPLHSFSNPYWLQHPPSPAPFKLTQKTNITGIFKVCVRGFCNHSFPSSKKQRSLARKIQEQLIGKQAVSLAQPLMIWGPWVSHFTGLGLRFFSHTEWVEPGNPKPGNSTLTFCAAKFSAFVQSVRYSTQSRLLPQLHCLSTARL